jgi:hypothetical protein
VANRDWSEWIPFAKGNETRIPESVVFGLYRNRLVDGSGKPIPVKHPGGVDPDGIVYIGASGVLTKYTNKPQMRLRFGMHVMAHQSGRRGGPTAKDKRLVRLWEKIRARDPNASMQLQYVRAASAADAAALEQQMQSEFRVRYDCDPDDLWCKEWLHPDPF